MKWISWLWKDKTVELFIWFILGNVIGYLVAEMTRSCLLTIIGLSLLGWAILGLAAAFLRFVVWGA